VVQAGHTALETEFCHPVVDQQEVSQHSPLLPDLLLGILRCVLGRQRNVWPWSNLALTHVSQLLLLLLHHAKSLHLVF
jgi:hypothetical protein